MGMATPNFNAYWWREKHKSWQVAVMNGRTTKSFAEWVDVMTLPQEFAGEPLPDNMRRCEYYITV